MPVIFVTKRIFHSVRSRTPHMPHIRSRFIRHQFRPSSLCSRHVTEFHTTPVAHTSVTFCNTRHRLSLSFGHVKPNGLTLPARRPVVLNGSKLRLSPLARAPGAQKPREKLLTFQRHSVDFSPTKHQPLCSAITINTS